MAKIENTASAAAKRLAHATEALRWLESHRIFKDRQWEEDRKNLLHRIERLKRKLAGTECGEETHPDDGEL
ncbi:MAG: hypothetical protein ACLUEQ_07330 [Cloacibacillus evryensis]